MTILLDTTIIYNIPVLTLMPDDAQQRPAIFFAHGFGGNKEAGLDLGYQLARRGFGFISFDAWLHGERYDERLEQAALPERGALYPPDSGLDTFLLFYRVIDQCRADVQTLIDHFAHDPRLDMTRCGVTGLSMGGYASYSIFANLPQVQAAVPMLGVPDFTRRWLDLLDECAFSNPAWAAALERAADQTHRNMAFVIYPAGHTVTPQMERAAVEWFVAHLR